MGMIGRTGKCCFSESRCSTSTATRAPSGNTEEIHKIITVYSCTVTVRGPLTRLTSTHSSKVSTPSNEVTKVPWQMPYSWQELMSPPPPPLSESQSSSPEMQSGTQSRSRSSQVRKSWHRSESSRCVNHWQELEPAAVGL